MERHICDFVGTNSKPYELTSVKSLQRPSEETLLNVIPTFEEYTKTRKSPVTINGLDVVLLETFNLEKTNNNYIPGISTKGFSAIAVERKTGFAWGVITSFHSHSLTSDGISYARNFSGKFSGKNVENDTSYFYSDDCVDDTIAPALLFIGDTVIANADENASDNQILDYDLCQNLACLSFDCLANLIRGKVVNDWPSKTMKVISGAKLSIVDFTPQETKPASAAIRENYSSVNRKANFNFYAWAAKQKTPGYGFSLIMTNKLEWHKPSTVVIRNGNVTYLMGQDEDTYFGCQLADNPNSIEEAYLSLIPAEARGVKGVLRQGEWFAIPVANQKSVPDRFDKNVILCDCDCDSLGLCFGLEDKDSNHHHLSGEIIVLKDGRYFVRNFEIEHSEHATLSGEHNVWYTFARNTAVASFSAERVD